MSIWETEIMTCTDIQCGPNAACQEIPGGQPECRCLPGYFGDGLYCYEHTGIDIPGYLKHQYSGI